METREYRTFDKSAWGPGPWQDEPDKMQFADEATGLPCLIVRNLFGALCGYVGVHEGHPFFGKRAFDDEHVNAIEAHCGLNFASLCRPADDESTGICHIPAPGEPDHVWWLGFDCCHVCDLAPAFDALHGSSIGSGTYKDVAYVKREIASLAAQLKAAA